MVSGPVAPGGDLGAAQAVTGALTSGLGNFGDFLGGGQIGYDWQLGEDRLGHARFVVGLEADIQAEAGAGVGGTLANAAPGAFNAANAITGNVSASEHLDYIGTARVRAGYLLKPNLLLYATGGLAYGQAELTTQTSLLAIDGSGAPLGSAFGSTRYSNMLVGWTAGGGFEWMFHPQLERQSGISLLRSRRRLGRRRAARESLPPALRPTPTRLPVRPARALTAMSFAAV